MQRTFLVWVIFLFVLVCVIFQFGSVILVYSGSLPLPPEAMAEIAAVGSDEIALNLIVGVYSLIAAIALFMMRRIALPLFLLSIPIAIGQQGWSIYLHGWDMVMGNGGLFIILFAFGLTFLICFYVWSLDRRGALA